jgi:hypothetical protein
MIGLIWISKSTYDLFAKQPPVTTKPRKATKTTPDIAARSANTSSGVSVIGIVAVALISSVVTAILINTFAVMRLNTALTGQSGLVMTPGLVRPPDPVNNKIFGIDVVRSNRGPLLVFGTQVQYQFRYPEKELTREQEAAEFTLFNAVWVPAQVDAAEERSGDGSFVTFQDRRFTTDDWTKVLNGTELVYLFVELSYVTGGVQKATEFCAYVNKDYPAVHKCMGHNRIIMK